MEERKKKVYELERKIDELETKIDELVIELETHEKEFDSEEFEEVQESLEEEKRIKTTHHTKIEEKKKQLKELNEKINKLEDLKKDLDEKEEELNKLEKDLEFTEFIRETYKGSRPLVTEILVGEISQEADQIYRDLRGNPSEELSWTKDYEIVVEEAGEERTFQKLSGGEQMCAALSVRLAILKILSKMNIVFLDEPTANLDEEKKDNLVDQLRNFAGFSQLFVISHDETFESMTEYVINLAREDGQTKVVGR